MCITVTENSPIPRYPSRLYGPEDIFSAVVDVRRCHNVGNIWGQTTYQTLCCHTYCTDGTAQSGHAGDAAYTLYTGLYTGMHVRTCGMYVLLTGCPAVHACMY